MFFPGRIGSQFRGWWLNSRIQSIGSQISTRIGLELTGGRNIRLGNRINIMRFNHFYAHNGSIEMGSDISITQTLK
jgi:hypothetical protein